MHHDFVRGLAAVLVLIGHTRSVFFEDHGELPRSGLFLHATYFLTGLGHQAVIIFFALSGYFIASTIMRSVVHWSWSDYLIARASRLYVVVLPGLLLTAAWDFAGMTFGDPGLYQGKSPSSVFTFAPAERSSVKTFVGNLAFLQTVAVPPFGTNSPLWSLCNEFWYYLLFPCLVLAVSRKPRWHWRITYLALVAAALCLLGGEIAFYFLVWLFGAAVRLIPPAFSPGSSSRTVALAASAVATLASVGAARWNGGGPGWDLLIGFSFSSWMYALLHDRENHGLPLPYIRLARGLSGCSFSLYVLHLPAVAAAYALFVGQGRWTPEPATSAIALLLLLAVVCYAVVFSRFTEARTESVRRAVRGWIFPSQVTAAE